MHILKTGQERCYDIYGNLVPCLGTSQDAEFKRGEDVPAPRFQEYDGLVKDCLTGLVWTKDANINNFPTTWKEGLGLVKELNRNGYEGHSDWRMPNRRELRSLLHMESLNPALPLNHPFQNVFHGWYWTSTTAAINKKYAWYVHLGGARMFYGRKDQEFLVWPVRGSSHLVPCTGQRGCFDGAGAAILCVGTGQDGEFQAGAPWPRPRFEVVGAAVKDRLTGLMWTKNANLSSGLVTWMDAFGIIDDINSQSLGGFSDWCLPNINELESLVDSSQAAPALMEGHPFQEVQEFYWSSTTSFYDPAWSWALYMEKGAIGVGLKSGRHFYVWGVRSEA